MDRHLFNVALYEGIWRVIASTTIAVILIICLSTGAASAFMIAAHVALLFTVLMIRNALELVAMAKPKRSKPETVTLKPATEDVDGNPAAMLTLGFAKAGSAIAAGFAAVSLIIVMVSA